MKTIQYPLQLAHPVLGRLAKKNMLDEYVTPPRNQRGVALAMSILFLLLLTLIGVTSMNTSVLQERMAGNMRDLDIALQAAETSLRFGEEQYRIIADRYCSNPPPPGTTQDAFGTWPLNVPQVTDPTWWTTNGILLQNDSVNQIAQAVEDPRHVIEYLQAAPGESGAEVMSSSLNPNIRVFTRISARGVGVSRNAEAVLRNTHQFICG